MSPSGEKDAKARLSLWMTKTFTSEMDMLFQSVHERAYVIIAIFKLTHTSVLKETARLFVSFGRSRSYSKDIHLRNPFSILHHCALSAVEIYGAHKGSMIGPDLVKYEQLGPRTGSSTAIAMYSS